MKRIILFAVLAVAASYFTSGKYFGGGQIVDDGKLVMTRFGAGYFDDNNNTYYYFTDYQGNNISLVNKSGSIVQTTDYYPYGEIYNVSSTNPGIKNNFLYGDKEYIFMDGLHEYDYGARRSIIPLNFFGSIDPHCENYYGISPYVLCAGNPIMRIDPNGKDCYSFDEMGELLEQEENPEKDIIKIVDLDNRTLAKPLELAYGTIKNISTSLMNVTSIEVDGDENGTKIFEYFAHNTSVEWSDLKTGENESGINYISTSHDIANESSYKAILKNVTNLRIFNHNHPSGIRYPSGMDIYSEGKSKYGDISVAKDISGKYGKNTVFSIYIAQKNEYLNFSAKSKWYDFEDACYYRTLYMIEILLQGE